MKGKNMPDTDTTKQVVVIDFETTGLSAINGAKIIEIGAVKLSGNRLVGVFETLVNPGIKLPKTTLDITGITDDMVKDAPPSSKVLPHLVDFIGDCVLVAHNVAFDRSFLLNELEENGMTNTFDFYCTLINSRRKLRQSSYKLGSLRDHYKFKTTGDMHRALSDSFVTAQLYLLLQNLYSSYITNEMFDSLTTLLNKKGPSDYYSEF